ncbi:MAG: nitrogen fixation protein NifK [Clostridiales bacterium]|nr:nitrogen fixation protein NifK [Clostridiales bacterium]
MSKIVEMPRASCVLGGLNAVLTSLQNVSPIYHSGPGCCMQTTAGVSGQAGLRGSSFLASVSLPCSNMLEREVVFGGEQKLRDEIDGSLEIIDADAYFVLTGCTAGIIGDDVAAVTAEYRNKGLPVYPIETPGFAGDTLLGYETAFDSFIEYIAEPQPRQANLVNLLGVVPQHDPYWFGTLEELTRILNKLGLEVNSFFTQRQGIETVKRSGSAALNIIVSPWLLKGAASKYEEKFGIPSIRFNGVPYGATQTAEFIRGVGEALDLDKTLVESVIEEENIYVYGLFETIIGALSWKKFVVAADAATAISITRFLADDFSFTPVAVIITEPIWSSSDKDRITKALSSLEYAKPPIISFLVDHYDIRQEIKKHDFTLLIGSSLEDEVARELGVQLNRLAFPISDQLIINRTYAGYRGCLTLVEDLYNNL